MDHDQNQGTPLTSLMNWDQDGELRSEDLERLLERLQAIEVIPRGKREPLRAGCDHATSGHEPTTTSCPGIN